MQPFGCMSSAVFLLTNLFSQVGKAQSSSALSRICIAAVFQVRLPSLMEPLPHDISEKIVQCFGRCFYYKDGLTAFLVSAGVEQSLASKHNHLAKFVWGRQLLLELAATDDGRLIQRKILTALCNLRELTDSGLLDKAAGLAVLKDLRDAAIARNLVKQKVREDERQRREAAEAKAELIRERSVKLRNLRDAFARTYSENDRQKAGYELERILKELFFLSDISFTASYRTETSQIDGHFHFEGFDYLVEAKWREDQPTQKEIAGFKDEVARKLDGTRGLFVSVVGYRSEVADQFNEPGAHIILMDGEHLMHVLDGRIELDEGLRQLIEHAAKRGVVYTKFVL